MKIALKLPLLIAVTLKPFLCSTLSLANDRFPYNHCIFQNLTGENFYKVTSYDDQGLDLLKDPEKTQEAKKHLFTVFWSKFSELIG